MYISKRKEKQDEGKLFTEVYMYFYLTVNSSIAVSELNSIAKRSIRTFQRYVKDLEEAGCAEPIYFYKKWAPAFYMFNPKEQPNSWDVMPQQTKKVSSSNQHIIKLNRILRAIDYYSTSLWDYFYEEERDAIKVLNYEDYKKHIDPSISQKTFERDIKLIKTVCKLYINQLED